MAIAAATAEAPLEPAEGVRRGPAAVPPPPLPPSTTASLSGSPLSGLVLVLTAMELFREMGRPPAMEFCEFRVGESLEI